MRFLVVVLAVLFVGCGITHTSYNPTEKTVDISTYTLFKAVEGFHLDWTKDGQVTIKLAKSSPEMEFMMAIAPILREMGPMVQALAAARRGQ